MHLISVGLSHRTAPVELREKAALTDAAARSVMRALLADPRNSEAVAISTCNRTELYIRTEDGAAAEEAACTTLVNTTGIPRSEFDCVRYTYREERVISHLLRVTSSLDAMVVGESEIQGQVRLAFERAKEEDAVGPVLDHLFRKALETGKRVRTETQISAGAMSVASVAVELAVQGSGGDLHAKRALLIGAGEMGAATAKSLMDAGTRELIVVNRTVSTARRLAAEMGGEGVSFDHLAQELATADIVISSTDAPHTILGHGDVESAMRTRPGRPMVLIDIAVPRDLDPGIATIPGVSLHDIDDLERVVEINRTGRLREAELAEAIVDDETRKFVEWRRSLSVTPTITSLRGHAEAIRSRELAKINGAWESLSDADRARVEQLTNAIINRLLHEPTVRLRAAVVDGDGVESHVESLRHLFALDGETS